MTYLLIWLAHRSTRALSFFVPVLLLLLLLLLTWVYMGCSPYLVDCLIQHVGAEYGRRFLLSRITGLWRRVVFLRNTREDQALSDCLGFPRLLDMSAECFFITHRRRHVHFVAAGAIVDIRIDVVDIVFTIIAIIT